MSYKKKASPAASPLTTTPPTVPQTDRQPPEDYIENLIFEKEAVAYQLDFSNCKSCYSFPPNHRLKVFRELLKLTASHLDVVELIPQHLPSSLVELNLSRNQLSQIPSTLGQACPNLRILNLSQNSFKNIPIDLPSIVNLEILDVSFNKITSIPTDIIHLRKLRILKANNNNLDYTPEEKIRISPTAASGGSNKFSEWVQNNEERPRVSPTANSTNTNHFSYNHEERLKPSPTASSSRSTFTYDSLFTDELKLPRQSPTANSYGSGNRFSDHYEEQSRQKISPTASSVMANSNRFAEFEEKYRNIANLTSLERIEEIDFSFNTHIRKLYFLESPNSNSDTKRTHNRVIKVNLSSCRVTVIPPELHNEKYFLILNGNPIYKLDDTMNMMRECVGLSLANCQLEKLEVKFFTQFTNLVELNLSNSVKKEFTIIIHKEIMKLKHLEKLWLNGNRLTSLPNEICSLEKLNYLNVANNELKELPPRIGRLKYLTELDATDNVLRSIPPSISKMPFLKKLSLKNNKISKIPYQLLNAEKGDEEEDGSLGNNSCLEYLNVAINNLRYIPYPIAKNFKGKLICNNNSFVEDNTNLQFQVEDEVSHLPDLSNLKELLCKWIRRHKINMDADFYNHSEISNDLKQRIKDAQHCSYCGEFYLNRGSVLIHFENDSIEGDFPIGVELCSRDCVDKYAGRWAKSLSSTLNEPVPLQLENRVEQFLKSAAADAKYVMSNNMSQSSTKSFSAREISIKLFNEAKWKRHIIGALHTLQKQGKVDSSAEKNDEGIIKWQIVEQPSIQIPSQHSDFVSVSNVPTTTTNTPQLLSSDNSLKLAIVLYLIQQKTNMIITSARMISAEVKAPISKVESILQELKQQGVVAVSVEKTITGEWGWSVFSKRAKDLVQELSSAPSGTWEQIPQSTTQQDTLQRSTNTPQNISQTAQLQQQSQSSRHPSPPVLISPRQMLQNQQPAQQKPVQQDSIRSGSDAYYCKDCGIQCTGPENYTAHVTGRTHKKNMNRKALLQPNHASSSMIITPTQQAHAPINTATTNTANYMGMQSLPHQSQQVMSQPQFSFASNYGVYQSGNNVSAPVMSSFVKPTTTTSMYASYPISNSYFEGDNTMGKISSTSAFSHISPPPAHHEIPTPQTTPPPMRASPPYYSNVTSMPTFHSGLFSNPSPTNNINFTGLQNASSTAVYQNSPFYCNYCDIMCTGPEAFQEHVQGRKHKNRVDELALASKQRSVQQNVNNLDTSNLPFDPELAPQIVNIILKHKYGVEFDYEFGEDGPPHNRIFTAKVHIPVLQIDQLVMPGKTKKEAKRNAAIAICLKLHQKNELLSNVPKAFLKSQ